MAKKKTKRITIKSVQAIEDKPFVPQVPIKPESDEDPWGDDGLTLKQCLFCEAFVGTAAGNATRAAQLAGYRDDNNESLRATASENLTKPNVQRAIARLLAQKRLSPEWVRDRLAELASTSMADFTVMRDGDLAVDWDTVAHAGAIGTVKEVIEDILPGGSGKNEVIRRKVKLHDPLPALALLAKMQKMMPAERHEHTGAEGKPIEVTHAFDNDRFADLYRRRTGRNQPSTGLAEANGN